MIVWYQTHQLLDVWQDQYYVLGQDEARTEELTGFSIDLIRTIAQSLNFR